MKYRAIINSDGFVIAVAKDTNQSGSYRNGKGTWCDFTFREFPAIPEDLLYFNSVVFPKVSVFKAVDGAIVSRDTEEVRATFTKTELKKLDIKVANIKLLEAEKAIAEANIPPQVKQEEVLLTALQESLVTQIDTAKATLEGIVLSTETLTEDIQKIKDAVNSLTAETAIEEIQTKITELLGNLTILKNKI